MYEKIILKNYTYKNYNYFNYLEINFFLNASILLQYKKKKNFFKHKN